MPPVNSISRKDALKSLIVLPAFAALGAALVAPADAKGTKAQFKYQDKPNGKKDCASCALFIPGKSATAAGGCKVVGGSISPKGWCIAYAPKAK